MIEWLLVPLAYGVGSISCAIIVCHLMGLPDPRGEGSGNPGATNVMRIGGKKAAALTLAGDALKGFLPVVLAKLLGVSDLVMVAVILSAFAGHLYPIFFGFKGGKGVATAFGLSLGVNVWLGLMVSGTWVLIYKIGKISSLSAMITAVLVPLYVWLMTANLAIVGAFSIISIVTLWRHRSNFKKLLAGNET